MAESFLFSIAESLIKRLSNRAYEEAFRAFNLNEDLGQLKDTLSIVKGVLLDAEVKQDLKHGLREWLRQIKDVFAEAQDVLDELECHAKQKQVLRTYGSIEEKVGRFLSFSPLAFRFRMARQIKEIREKLNKVAADRHKFDLERIEVDRGVVHRREMTYSHVIASDVIGRDRDKQNIIDLLFPTHSGGDASMGLSVVPIVGIGGMGKTTLAKLVFNDERIDREFPLKMWVCVSEDFDIRQLMIKIINCVPAALGGQENITNLDVEQLQNHLKNRLTYKKFLLILDDVWNDNRVKWVELQNLLQVGVGGRIIVTTRSKKIAEMMSTISLIYELHSLTDKESLAVFVKWAFREGEEKNYPNLVKIGKEIVRKCKGVPLAVRTLASSLFLNFNEEEWKSLRNNEIWDVSQKENDIVPALKLSYDRMPSYLRQCFSFFSLYPKDFEFDSTDVTELWMAFGLLQPSNESLKLEDVATQYLHELHSRCFLQDFIHFGYFNRFKMHDLVHDLAVFVSKEEFLMVNSNTQMIHENCRHLSIVENDSGQGTFNEYRFLNYDRNSSKIRKTYYVKENSHKLDCFLESKRVKSIIFPVEGVGLGMNSQVFLNKWLSKYKYLWVLDLSDSSFTTLPTSIGKLRCLRHLNLSFNRYLEKLPDSICELQSLQTLLLKGCERLRALPKGLRKLISLRQLALTTMQSDLYETDISSLTSLQILRFDSCLHFKSLLGGIQLLTSLRELSIHDCEALDSFNFDCIAHLPELVALSIVDCPKLELSEGHDNLKTTMMKLRFVRFQYLNLPRLPKFLQGAVDTLHTLMIEGCFNLVLLPDWLSTFSQLNTLRIVKCGLLFSLPNNMKGFTAFECLEIVGCHPELEREYRYEVGEHWPNISHLKSITIINELVALSIVECPKLKLPEGHDNLETTRMKLRFVRFEYLPDLVSLPKWLQRAADTLHTLMVGSCDNLWELPGWLPTFSQLITLRIQFCERLWSLPNKMRGFTALECLEIVHCRELERKCRYEVGEYWPNISHLNSITIKGRFDDI